MQQHKTNVFQRFEKHLETLAGAISGPSGRIEGLSEVLGELSGRALGALVGALGVLRATSGRRRDIIGAVSSLLGVM